MKQNEVNQTLQTDSEGSSTRMRIISAARAEFAQYGQAGARVDRIARSAGINKAMIYYHFSSKAQLYRAVIQSHFELIGRRLKTELLPESDLETSLTAVATTYAALLADAHDFRALMLRELAQPSDVLLDGLAELIRDTGVPQRLLEAFAKEQREGRFRAVDFRHALVSFMSMNFGYILLYPLSDRILQIDDRRKFIEQRPAEIVSLFLDGLKVRQA